MTERGERRANGAPGAPRMIPVRARLPSTCAKMG